MASFISQLPTREEFITLRLSEVSSNYSVEENCAICCEDFDTSTHRPVAFSNPSYSGTVCKHIFGKPCIIEWFNGTKNAANTSSCPMCRKRMFQDMEYDVPNGDFYQYWPTVTSSELAVVAIEMRNEVWETMKPCFQRTRNIKNLCLIPKLKDGAIMGHKHAAWNPYLFGSVGDQRQTLRNFFLACLPISLPRETFTKNQWLAIDETFQKIASSYSAIIWEDEEVARKYDPYIEIYAAERLRAIFHQLTQHI